MTAAETFSTHKDPVWRDRANFLVNARLPEKGRFEQLWVRKISDDKFEICCIPFFLYDVALGDIVQTEDFEDHRYLFARVLEPSGRYVFRAHFTDVSEAREEVLAQLVALGAAVEWSSATLIAIDAPDGDHAQRVVDFLHISEEGGQLIYEMGKTNFIVSAAYVRGNSNCHLSVAGRSRRLSQCRRVVAEQ